MYYCQIWAEGTVLAVFPTFEHTVSQLSMTAMTGQLPRQSTISLNLIFMRLNNVFLNSPCNKLCACVEM